ncbi:hypothetical protein Tco_0901853 [Tanacetum coccineum]
MTLTATNWNSTIHLEVRKALQTDIIPLVTHNDAVIKLFELEFVKEVAKFVRDYKSLKKEADESLEKVNFLDKENDCLLEVVLFSDAILTILHSYDNICAYKPSELTNLNQELENIVLKKTIWVTSTTRGRGPKSKVNTNIDRVSFASKTGCFKNKVEEHRRNSLSFANKKHVPCTKNVKLAKLNGYNEFVGADCKKCLFDNVHDAYFSKLVNDMNSHAKAQHAKVSNIAYQKKLKAKAKKKEMYSKEVRTTTPSVSPPGSSKPKNYLRIGLLQAHKRESEATRQFHLEVYGNC